MAIHWYRTPLDKARLKTLAEKSDRRGWLQAIGHLSLLIVSGSLCYQMMTAQSQYLFLLLLLLFVHGTLFTFLGWAGASHELLHRSVFKRAVLNDVFLTLFSLLSWNNKVLFSRSHKRHHSHTLQTGQDGEVDPNAAISRLSWLLSLTFNYQTFYIQLKYHFLNSIGDIRGGWAIELFPEADQKGRRQLINWSRTVLLFHFTSMVFFFALGLWPLVILVNLASYFGNFFPMLLAAAQHSGKVMDSRDFRANSRTVIIHPLFEFLYWGMNFHIEHHMYPHVPFYRLSELRRELEHDLPPAAEGMLTLFKAIKLPIKPLSLL